MELKVENRIVERGARSVELLVVSERDQDEIACRREIAYPRRRRGKKLLEFVATQCGINCAHEDGDNKTTRRNGKMHTSDNDNNTERISINVS